MSTQRRAVMVDALNFVDAVDNGMSDRILSRYGQIAVDTLRGGTLMDESSLTREEAKLVTLHMTEGLWAKSGFPTLEPSHKLAASLMATSVPAETAKDVVWPWPAFSISVPRGVFPSDVGEPSFLLVAHEPNSTWRGMTIACFFENHQVIFWMLESDAELLEPPAGEAWSGADGRLRVLLSRLLYGCCIELERAYGPLPNRDERPGGPREKRGEPVAWTFKLARPVKVDCRPWVAEYLGGKGVSPSVQVLVRGHHKHQPHGPGRTLRKWIHVEPYWRGPEDAPIAVRSHKLGGAEA